MSGWVSWAHDFSACRTVILRVIVFTDRLTPPALTCRLLLRRRPTCFCLDMVVSTCVTEGQECGICEYCCWKDSGCPLECISNAYISCPEAARLTSVYGASTASSESSGAILGSSGAWRRRLRSRGRHQLGMTKEP